MGRYTDASKELVERRSALEDIAGQVTALRRSGPDELTGLCPLHEERTASFKVTPSKGLFRCWGCGATGDVFTFVMLHRHLDFVAALEHLAQHAGVDLVREQESAEQQARRERNQRLLAVLARAATFYAHHLRASAGADALAYLHARGLQDAVLDAFAVGFAPPDRAALLLAAAKSETTVEDLVAAGLAVVGRGGQQPTDRFHNRVIFPISDWRGRIVGFGGRRLAGGGAKYVNTRQGPLFNKRELLYGASHARAAAASVGTVVVVEGYTDVLAFHQAGALNTVATMGTSVTEQQVALLKRLAPRVVFVMDGDRGGIDAALRAGEMATTAGLDVAIATLPAQVDPADLAVVADANARVAALLARSVSLARFALATLIDRADLCTTEAKDTLIDDARPIIQSVRPGPVREALVATLADAVAFRASTVASWVDGGPQPDTPSAENPAADHAGERACLRAALTDPTLRDAIDPAAFTKPLYQRAARLLSEHPQDPVAALPVADVELARLFTMLLTT